MNFRAALPQARPWGPVVLRGAVGGWLLVNGLRFATALPPGWGEVPLWRDGPSAWWPLLPLVAALGGLALVRAGLDARRLLRDGPEPSPPPPQGYGPDLLLALLVATGGLAAAWAWRMAVNPESLPVGTDANAWTQNVTVVSRGLWDEYMLERRVLHARLAALLGGDPAAAAVDVSTVATGLLPLAAFLLARPLFGRGPAALAAVVTLAHPWAWEHGVTTTGYALFYLLVTGSLAALAHAFLGGRTLAWGGFGLLAGLAASTQEKAGVTLAPVLLAGGLLLAPTFSRLDRRGRLRALGRPLVALLVASLTVWILAPPIQYTPFGSILVNQREELHREIPYTWAATATPDPTRPSPLSPWLPDGLRGGDLEAALSALTTPPDSDVLRLRTEGGRATWSVVPRTSVAPLEVRLRFNLDQLRNAVGRFRSTGLLLLGLGLLGLLLPGGALDRRRRAVALAVAAALVSAVAPLGFKFILRYVVHLAPVGIVLAVGGTDRLVRLLAGAGLPGATARTLLAGGWLLLAHGSWNGDAAAWLDPRLPFPPPSARAPDDPGGYARATRRMVQWLAAHPGGGPVDDCAPMPLWIFLPDDQRLTWSRGSRHCVQRAARPEAGRRILVSGHREFRGPAHPDPVTLARAGWVVVWGWDGARDVEIGAGGRLWNESALLLMEAPGSTPVAQ